MLPLSCCPWPAWPSPLALQFTEFDEHSCPYLLDRPARSRAFYVENLPGAVYQLFMDAGFRRSGKIVYQPICPGCRKCLPLRVDVEHFARSRGQRRCWRLNQDLVVQLAEPLASDEKYELYVRYQRDWHGRAEADSREAFEAFLYNSPIGGVEFTYRDGEEKLLAVGLCDLLPDSLSSVYFYFDPASSWRGLGNFGALYELEFARQRGLGYYYLGFWVKECGAMTYKSQFRPCEFLDTQGQWQSCAMPGSAVG